MKKLLAMLLVMMAITSTACAETIRVYRSSYYDAAQKALADKYPGLEVEIWKYDEATFYQTTAEFAAPLQTREFTWDIFTLSSDTADAQLLMEKGFLLDLSSNEQIRAYVERMYPSVAAQCMRDGKIYALPLVYHEPSQLEVMCVDMDNWLAAGFTKEDIPTSFPAYLDFIERYIERCEADPDFEYVITLFDSDDYNRGTWPSHLLNQFIGAYKNQCGYLNETMRFNSPEIIGIVERIEDIGARLYALNPHGRTEQYNPHCLFIPFPGWEEFAESRVNLRLNEDSPTVTPMFLTLLVANAAAPNPELAADFLLAEFEAELRNFPSYAATIFPDAEPVQENSFERVYSDTLNRIAICERAMADDDTPLSEYVEADDMSMYTDIQRHFLNMDKWELQEQLDSLQRSASMTLERQWILSPEDLAVYQAHADELYFTQPGPFDVTQGSRENYRMMWHQFADGQLNAREFCEQADRIVWMMEMENQ